MAWVAAPRVFRPTAEDRGPLLEHFRSHGWVVVDALSPTAAAALPHWVDAIASMPDGAGGVLQHYEATDVSPQLCRSENFIDVHAELRLLLSRGSLIEVAATLLGEPAVLYKEKINYKLPGGAGCSPHQDAPATR
jgi:2-aminoethylphosphonate dioxygenase